MQYKVEYENEITADSPLEAANAILCELQAQQGSGRVFIITELATGRKYSVDVDDDMEELEEKL